MSIKYKGIEYPTRTFAVEHDHYKERVHYTIAPESLLDVFESEGDSHHEFGTEAYNVDTLIYHYVDDKVFNNSAEDICKNHLDKPFELIEEVL